MFTVYQQKALACVILIFIILSTHEESFAQKFKSSARGNTHKHATYRNKKPFGKRIYNALGISLSALNYYGDLAPQPGRFSTDIKLTRPGIGLSYIRKKGPRLSVRAEFIYGVIQGADNSSADARDAENGFYRYRRNLSFRNRLKEFSFIALYDLLGNHGFYYHRYEMMPYVFTGATVFYHNPQAKAPSFDLHGNPLPQAGQWINLRPLGTEGQYSKLVYDDANYGVKPYSKIQFAIPAGVGLRVKVNQIADLWFEVSFRYLFTDYIDDVSGNYVDLGILRSDLARAMSYRNNELGLSENSFSYTGRDGNSYSVEAGYGSENPDNIRGNKSNNDFLMVITIRGSRILNAIMHKAKSR
jgi:hypothetical protein